MAQESDIQFIDLTQPFEEEAAKGMQLFFDIDIHFNENGHMVVASTISKMFPQLFEPLE